MKKSPHPVADAAGRPGFQRFIRQDTDYDGVKGFGFCFAEPPGEPSEGERLGQASVGGKPIEPPCDGGANCERYAMLYRPGMSVAEFADALQKIVDQMRTRTGANGDEALVGNEVNRDDFGKEAA